MYILRTCDFRKGMRVRYTPPHVEKNNHDHPHVKLGCVSSTNDNWVFVKYDNAMCVMTTGDEPYTAAATSPADLEILNG